MMLLAITVPPFPKTEEYGKRLFEKHFNLKTLRLTKYLLYEFVQEFCKESTLFYTLCTSDTIYGFQVNNGQIYIYPDHALKKIANYQRKLLKKEISSIDSLLYLH